MEETPQRKWNVVQDPPKAQEQQIIDNLRTQLADKLRPTDDNAMIARFCRARTYNFDQTKLMLENFLKWRDDIKADMIQMTPELDKFFKYQTVMLLPSVDKFGRSILFCQPRNHNPNVRDMDISNNAFYYVINLAISRLPEGLENYVTITDLAGYGLRNNDWGLMKAQANDLSSYYPERLGVSFIINAPWFVPGVWKVLSRWLDERTRRKNYFLGKDFKATLLEVIDENSLPEILGGKLKLPPQELDMWANIKAESPIVERDLEKELEKAQHVD